LTRARLVDIETAEQALPIEELVQAAVDQATVEEFDFPASAGRATGGSGEVGSRVER
jgi:hypothetical protein